MRLVPLVLACSLAACKSGGNEEDDFPDCETEGEAEFVDEIGLDYVSVDAYRTVSMGTNRYDVIVHGSDDDTTQFTIGFAGTPIEGMEYEVTEALVNDQPVLTLYPMSTAPDLVAGTLTFTQLGTDTGDLLGIELRLELATGRLDGCIRAPLTTTTDGSTTGDTSGGSGDSTG